MKTTYVLVILSLALSGQALAQLTCTNCTVTIPATASNEQATVRTASGAQTAPILDNPNSPFTGRIELTGDSEFVITGTGHYIIDGVISSVSTPPTSLTLSAIGAGGWGGKLAGITFKGTAANTYSGLTTIKSGYIACNKKTPGGTGLVAIPGDIRFQPGSGTAEAGLWFGADNQLGEGKMLKFERAAGAVASAYVNLNGTTQRLLGIENAATQKDIIGNGDPSTDNAIPPSLTDNRATKAVLILTGNETTTATGTQIASYTFGSAAELRGSFLQPSDNGGLEIQVDKAQLVFNRPSNIKNLTFNTGGSAILEVSSGSNTDGPSAFGYGITFKGTGTIKKTGLPTIEMDGSTISQSGGKIWVKEGTLKNKGTSYPTGDTEKNKALLQVDAEGAGAVFDMSSVSSVFGGLTGGGKVENNWNGYSTPLVANWSAYSTLTLNLNDNQTQTFTGVIRDNYNGEVITSRTGEGGINLTKEGNGKQILNGDNTFTGSVNITGGFLGGTGKLYKARGVTVAAGGSIGGGLGTADNGGTLTVSNLIFGAAAAGTAGTTVAAPKLIVTKRSGADNTPSLVEVKASDGIAAGTITGNFTVDIVGTTIESGYILKGNPDTGSRPVATAGAYPAGKFLSFEWRTDGLYMTVLPSGLSCDNCSFTGQTAGSKVILAAPGEFDGTITLNADCKFTIGGTGNYTLSGKITSAAGTDYSLTFSAPNVGENGIDAGFILSGSAANDYTGTTTLENGYLICNKTSATAIPKDIKILSKNGKKASLWCMVGGQFGGTTVIDFTGAEAASYFYLNGTTQTVAGLTANSTFATIVNSTATGTTNRPNALAEIQIGVATLNVAPSGTSTFGGGGSIYNGVGTSLTVNITSGTQIIENPGGNIHDVTLTSGTGATLEFKTTGTESYSIMGGTEAGNVKLKGAGTIKKTGAGTVSMSKTSTLLKSAGEVWVSAGTLKNGEQSIYTDGTESNKALLKMEASTSFDIHGNNSFFGGLTGGGTVYNNLRSSTDGSGGYNTLTLNLSSDQTFDGVIKNNDTNEGVSTTGTGKGGINLKKEGNGTQTLTGDNLYTGSTTVSAGKLTFEKKLNGGTYAGAIEIANVAAGTTAAVFEYKGSDPQTFTNVISSGSGTGTNLGTFRQSGGGKSIINNGTNTFTGKVEITGGFLGGTGDLSKANGVSVGEHGSIGGGNGTADNGGTLIVSNLTFDAAASKLIVTKRSGTNNTPSLVEVKASGTTAAGTITATHNFTVVIEGTTGTTIESGYILKGTPFGGSKPLPTVEKNDTGKSVSFEWDNTGLLMTVLTPGLVCDNCSFKKNDNDQTLTTGTPQNPQVILGTPGTFSSDITLNGPCRFTIGGKGNYTLSGQIKKAVGTNIDYTLTFSAPSAAADGLDAGFTLSGGTSNDYEKTILENGYIICNKDADKAAIPKNIEMLSKDGKKASLWCVANNNQFGSQTVIDFIRAEALSSFYLNGTTQTVAGLKANNSSAQVINNLAASFHPAGMSNEQVKTADAATLNIAAPAPAPPDNPTNISTFGGGGSIFKGENAALTVNITSGTQIIENPGGNIHDVTLSAGAGATLAFKTTSTTATDVSTFGSGITFKGIGTIKKTGSAIITMDGITISQSSGGIIQVNGGTLQNNGTIYPTTGDTENKALLHVDAGAVFDIHGINSLFGGLGGGGTVYNNLRSSTVGSEGYNTLTLNQNDTANPSTFPGIIRDNSTNAAVAPGEAKGGIALKKEGSGTQILTGVNRYTGSTTVSAGTLKLGGGGKLGGDNGTYGGALEIANVAAETTGVVFEHNGTQTQTFTSDITNTGGGSVKGTFRQSGTGQSIISGAKTFTGNVNITGGFLGGTGGGDLSKAHAVTVEAGGSIGGGLGTAGNGGTLIVSNLNFAAPTAATAAAPAISSKLIVTSTSTTTTTITDPSLVDVRTTAANSAEGSGSIVVAGIFKIDVLGTNLRNGHIIKCTIPANDVPKLPLPVLGDNTTGKYPTFYWDTDGLHMTLIERGLACDNCRFTRNGQTIEGSTNSPVVIIDGIVGGTFVGGGTFEGDITLTGLCKFTIGGTGNYTLSGKITGPYSLKYSAPGAGADGLGAGFTLSGTASNDYTGSTTLENGYLICNRKEEGKAPIAIPKNIQILSKEGKKASLWCMADNQFGSETLINFSGAGYEAAIWLNSTTQRAAGLMSDNGYANVNNNDGSPNNINTPGAVTTRGSSTATLNIAVLSGQTYTFTGGGNMNKWGPGGDNASSQALTVNVMSGTQIIENPKTRQSGGAVIFTSAATTGATPATLELKNTVTTGTDADAYFGGSLTTIQGEGILKKTGPGTISINSTLVKSAGEVLVSDGILKNGAANTYVRGTGSNTESNKAILNIIAPAAGTDNNYPAFDVGDSQSIFGGLTGSGYVYKSSTNVAYTTLTLNPSGTSTSTFSGVIRDKADITQAAVAGAGVALEKKGSGTQALTGDNLYTGSTTVSAGTLRLEGGGRLGGKSGTELKRGTYAGELEIANVSSGTAAVFEHNGTTTQTFTGVIKSSGTGTGTNLGTFRQSGTGKSIINGTNTFTGKVNITGGFLGGTGDLSKANGVTVAGGSIGGGLDTEDNGGTLIVSNLTFSGGTSSKLIVTKRPGTTDNTPSLVDVRTNADNSGIGTGTVTAATKFTVKIVVGTTIIKSGYIIKCTGGANLPTPDLATLPTTLAGKVRLTWDSNGLWMQVREGTIELSISNEGLMICPKGSDPGNPSIKFKATYDNASDIPSLDGGFLDNYSFTLLPDNAKSGNIDVVKSDDRKTITLTFNGASSTDADLTYTITYDDHRNPPVTRSEQKINRRATLTVTSGARLTEGKNTICLGTPLVLQAAGNGVASGTMIVDNKGTITFRSEDNEIVAINSVERTASTATAMVTTKKAGDAYFWFTDKDGCKSDYLLVSVKENPAITSTTLSTICAFSDDNMPASKTLSVNHEPAATSPWVMRPAGVFSLDDLVAKKATLTIENPTITEQKIVTVEYTDNFGCKGTTVITVNPNPVILLPTSTPSWTICASNGVNDAAIKLTASHDPMATTTAKPSAWALKPAVAGEPLVAGVSVSDPTSNDKEATFQVTSSSITKQVQANVQYTDNLGCKGVAIITVNPVPVMTVSPDKTICSGDKTSISLSVSNLDNPGDKLTYSWTVTNNSLGAKSSDKNKTTFDQQTLTVGQGGAESSVTYTFTPRYTEAATTPTTTAANYCDGQTAQSKYTVAPRGTASISNSQTTPGEVCLDDKITLKAEPATGNYKYQWLKKGVSIEKATGNSFTVPTDKVENASYSVNITNSSNCVASSNSKEVNVTQDVYFTDAKATMDKKVVEINRPVNFKYEGPDAVYSWDFGDKTAAVTTQNPSHNYSTIGTYKPVLLVVKPNQANCKKTLALPDLSATAITGDLSGSTALSVYPVPAQDRLTIVNESGDLQKITIRDLSGKQVVNEAVNGNKATVSVAHLTNGIYLLSITCSKGVKHMKISKN